MKEELKQKIQSLKSSFSVEGMPLIKSDRFTQEELDEMKKTSTAHESHWYHLKKNAKVWSDEEISGQLETFLKVDATIDDAKIVDIAANLMKKLPIENQKAEKEQFIKEFHKIIGLEGCVPFHSDFWSRFGSAPFSIRSSDTNKKLVEAKKKYGACGMDELFEERERFSNAYHLTYNTRNIILNFDKTWVEIKRKKDLAKKVTTSPFNSLEEIEDNVVVKKIEDEAKKFYHDKTKNFDERVKVFSKHGKHQDYIFHPSDPDLAKLFDIYTEGDHERHENIDTPYIVEYWVYELKSHRCKLDWTNHYPKIKETKRNYTPSQAAIDRLYKYYVEKLFLEEVGSFNFDW